MTRGRWKRPRWGQLSLAEWLRRQQHRCTPAILPALRRTLRAVGCHVIMPTRLEWPSSTTTGSAMGATRPFSGICHTCGGHRHQRRKGGEGVYIAKLTHFSSPPYLYRQKKKTGVVAKSNLMGAAANKSSGAQNCQFIKGTARAC